MRKIMEYGVYPEDWSAKAAARQGAEAVVAALNNADVDGVLLQLLRCDAGKVFRGMELAAGIVGASRKVLHIPEYAAELAQELAPAAAEAGVEIEVGIVDVRANSENLITHIVTMAELAEETPAEGIYVSVNGGQLKKVPAGTTLRELVGDVKGVRTGYVIRNRSALDMTVAEAGIENGVVNAITDGDCVVSAVQQQLLACRGQSCGKCVFCREGLIQLEGLQKDITVGRGTLAGLEMTREVGEAMVFSTPCSMGQKSSLLPMSAVDAFRGEYEDHIKKHKCEADACKAFRKVYIDPVKCTGCTACMAACPEDAVDGAAGYIHIVFDNGCTKCGACIGVCPEEAIHVTTGRVPRLPDRMLRVGRFRR